MFLLEVGGFMLIGLKQMLAGKKWNTWGWYKIFNCRAIPIDKTPCRSDSPLIHSSETNWFGGKCRHITPHSRWKGVQNMKGRQLHASVGNSICWKKISSHKLRAAEQSIYFASSVWCLRPTLCWWSIKHSPVLGHEKRSSSPCFRAFEKFWAFEETYGVGKPTYGSLKKLKQTH